MMYQCSFTSHVVLVSRMYNYVCKVYARASHDRSGRGRSSAAESLGVCNQYAGQRVRMSFAG